MPAKTLVAVWNARYDRTELYPEPEARAGMLRWAATLPDPAARACYEDYALSGVLGARSLINPAWIPEPSS